MTKFTAKNCKWYFKHAILLVLVVRANGNPIHAILIVLKTCSWRKLGSFVLLTCLQDFVAVKKITLGEHAECLKYL